MEDIDFLKWLYSRLKYVYNESPNYDFMIQFKNIIDRLEKEENGRETGETKERIT